MGGRVESLHFTRDPLPRPPDADVELALLQIGDIARDTASALTDLTLWWAATYPLARTIPKTPATLSLRARLAKLDKAMNDAEVIAYSISESLRVSLEKFPLPEELPPDDREDDGMIAAVYARKSTEGEELKNGPTR